MTISTRTPEGRPNSCPICRAIVVVEPSVFIGDATCPNCGHLLWFVQTPESVRLIDGEKTPSKKERAIDIVATQLGVDRNVIENNSTFYSELLADSLDIAELVMELEEEFD